MSHACISIHCHHTLTCLHQLSLIYNIPFLLKSTSYFNLVADGYDNQPYLFVCSPPHHWWNDGINIWNKPVICTQTKYTMCFLWTLLFLENSKIRGFWNQFPENMYLFVKTRKIVFFLREYFRRICIFFGHWKQIDSLSVPCLSSYSV